MTENKKRLNFIAEKLKLPKEKIIFIDDNKKFVHREDMPYSLRISPFKGDEKDYALPLITAKLIMMSDCEDTKKAIKKIYDTTDDDLMEELLKAIPYSKFNINK